MSNWEQWLSDDGVSAGFNNRGRSKKPNKNYYCRKNKIGNKQYGLHEYKDDGNTCIKCGHIRNKQTNVIELKESENKHEQRDE